jgi:RNA polymerase sigma factor (sigma-70 family)
MDLTARSELLRAAMTHAQELARFFRSRVSDTEDAQDLMQELYLALLKMPSSPAIRHPKAYLFTIAANLVHQHWQRSKTNPIHVSLDDIPPELVLDTQPAIGANEPESAAMSAERLSQIEQRLSQLSAKIQAAILWHHRDGYTCDEIGEKLSVVRHRVKKYLVRGLSHCRTMPTAELA